LNVASCISITWRQRGRDLFRVACERDLEGIVGKWAHGTYQTTGAARRG